MGEVQDEERARRDGGAWRGKSVGRGSFHFFTFSLNYSLPSLSLEDVTSSAVAAAAARVARASSIALIAFGPFVAVVIRALSAVLLSYELLLPPLSSLLLLSSPEVCHHLFSSPLVQDNGLDPIVEPKILLDGDHPIERTLEVAEKVWSEVFFYLAQNNVIFEGILLKPSMVTPGAEHKEKASPETIAKYTLTMLRRRVPPAVPGIMFLSGGQSEVEATLNLNAMNQSPNPWHVSFSYARALF
ncbi:hypothetical protein Ahy_A04g020556 [Arachis hypogaea]|uniref:Fructose-bisphosphate aldolase n=1 Tax=Arachis hypogaea TaxID=3818 RepID=A0A445DHY6_ARAHY|nr:hypothetical protein Ahy_A04g020556 [Arachis hypogaea]